MPVTVPAGLGWDTPSTPELLVPLSGKVVTFAATPHDSDDEAIPATKDHDAKDHGAKDHGAKDHSSDDTEELTMVEDADDTSSDEEGEKDDTTSPNGSEPTVQKVFVNKKNPEKTEACPTCGKKYTRVSIHYTRSKYHEPARFARLQAQADPEKKRQPQLKSYKSDYTYATAVQNYIDKMLEETQGPDIDVRIGDLERKVNQTRTRVGEQGLLVEELKYKFVSMKTFRELEQKFVALEAMVKANATAPKRVKIDEQRFEQRVAGLEKWTEDSKSWNKKNWTEFDRRIKALESAESQLKDNGTPVKAAQFRVKSVGDSVKMSIFFNKKKITEAVE